MSYFKHHKPLMFVAIVLVVVGAIVASHINKKTSDAVTAEIPRVTLVSAGSFAGAGSSVSSDGSVESLEQVELRSQVYAPVTAINVSIGKAVQKDDILVTMQNADVLAQLSQARAAVSAQQARLDELKKGARAEDLDITETELKKANQDVANAYSNVTNTLNDAYTKADDAVRKQLDPLFSDDETTPKIVFVVSNAQAEIDAEFGRKAAGSELNTWKNELFALGSAPTPDECDAAITKSKKHLEVIREFLTKVMDVVVANINLPQATLDGYKASVSAGRANVNLAFSNINAQEQGIGSLKLAAERALNQLNLKKAGSSSEQIASQEAAVEQANASVRNLEAQVSKTIIRAPVSGTVSAVPVHVGDLLTPGQSVLSIVNISGLQIKSFISDTDVQNIEEGSEVTVGGKVVGKVSRIAPSIDQKTKKVEVNILVSDPKSAQLIVGQSVTVSIAAKKEKMNSLLFTLPLQAVRITTEGARVFTVDEQSNAKEIPVTIGEAHGESVEITGGLTSDIKIISSVYELSPGQKVIVEQ